MMGRSQEELVAMLRSTKQGESVCVVVARQEDIFLPRELVRECKYTAAQHVCLHTACCTVSLCFFINSATFANHLPPCILFPLLLLLFKRFLVIVCFIFFFPNGAKLFMLMPFCTTHERAHTRGTFRAFLSLTGLLIQ